MSRLVPLSSLTNPGRRRWYERFPEPVERAALACWSALPWVVRRPFVALFGPSGSHSSSGPTVPGPDTVAGVAVLRAEGFTPMEELTGDSELHAFWPVDHVRRLTETRSQVFDLVRWDEWLYLLRSPWPEVSIDQVMLALWPFIEDTAERADPRERPHSNPARYAAFFAQDAREVLAVAREYEDDEEEEL